MKDSVRWVLAIVAAALVVSLIAWARGPAHHRGIDVGSLGSSPGLSAATTTHRQS